MSSEARREELLVADREARLAAQTRFADPLILEAGAGTGKTAALVSRVVAWSVGEGWRRAEAEEGDRATRLHGSAAVEGDRVAARVLDGVVAVTFTEAAAAEMANRVGEALASLAREEWPAELDRRAFETDEAVVVARARALLVGLDHLQVTTIHSFCRRLLAAWPFEAGLHPGFTVDADDTALTAIVQAEVEAFVRGAFVRGANADLLALAATGVGPAEIAEAVSALISLGVPGGALEEDPLGPPQISSTVAELEAAFAGFEASGGAALAAVTRGMARDAVAALRSARRVVQTVSGSDLASLEALCSYLTLDVDGRFLKKLAAWGNDDFTGSERASIGSDTGATAIAARALSRAIERFRRLDPLLLDRARRVVGPLVEAVERRMRLQGAETFHALLLDTRDLLRDHPVVAERERSRIRQLLVDEFQDTDQIQCDVFRLLALEGPPVSRPGLFVVGDPKQSIYGWRSADLAAYQAFVADVVAASGSVMRLSVNYRSVPAILAEVERCVAPVMVAEEGVQPPFEPLLAFRAEGSEVEGSEVGRPGVEFWVSWEADPAGGVGPMPVGRAAELEARVLARDVRERHAAGVLPWSGIGILLRSMSDVETYLAALRDEGVPYRVERDTSYYRRREVVDAVSLVRAVLDPADHLALVAWLRSAAVGVPDAAWIPLWERGFPDRATALGLVDGGALADLRPMIEEVAAAVPVDIPGIGRIRGWEQSLLAALADLADLRASFALDPAAVFVEKLRTLTLLEPTEAARYLGPFRVANLERFFRLLLTALERGSATPESVLRELRLALAEERDAEEGRPADTLDDAVRVMSVHRAKGLDFGHVYLVQVNKGAPTRDRRAHDAERVDRAWEYRLFGAPTPGWGRVEERRRRVRAAELVRLGYVALTRARDRLVVAGAWPAGGPAGELRSLAELLQHRQGLPDLAALFASCAARGRWQADAAEARWVFPALAPRSEGAAVVSARPDLAPLDEVVAETAALAGRRAEAAARMARPFGAAASAEAHRAFEEAAVGEGARGPERRARQDNRREVATAVGSAVHACLEALDLARPVGEGVEAVGAVLDAHLGNSVAGEHLASAGERSRDLLRRFAASALGRRLESVAAHVVARELPFLAPPRESDDAAAFIAGAIDLVYRDPGDGSLVVVDFKTDEVADGPALTARAEVYLSQGKAYAVALAEALALDVLPRFELWFIWPGRVVEVPLLGDPNPAADTT